MSEIPFHQTRMGHAFYEHTVPELVRQLTRLNAVLERLVECLPADDAEEAPHAREKERR